MRNRLNLIFIFPGVWRPQKENFAKKFQLLSDTCSGFIFTASSTRHRDLAIGNFRLWSEMIDPNPLIGWLKRFWVQALLPIYLLWGRQRTKLIVETNGEYDWVDPATPLLKKTLMRFLLHLSVSAADAVKVLNRAQEEFLKRRYPDKRVYRFPNIVASEYLRSLKCYQGDYLLCVGFPFHRKGVDVVIGAFRSICKKHPTIKLKIMGYCPDEELTWYKQLAGDESRIEFVKPGWIEDVGEQMRGCYALVHAARSEAAGRVQFEAMACRKPVVATRTSGSRDYVQDGETGLLCEIDDVEGLARNLDYLLSEPGVAAQMGEAGFERLQKKYSEDKYAQSFYAMVEEVVRGEAEVAVGLPS
jgi:glycosyltransferase involved in cell wall biosynthesis